ncbi:MAG TPA: toll/interleukin-1 receptor domain-containing protein, partial [Gaiellales bacterium]|nr:toll/interleukin-1 receptor domain-containing protein [Gaiellales bacterium]
MRLFFSYSRSDAEVVHRLRQDLERAGHEIWLDRDDIPGGAAWRRSIGEGIAGADVVLVVVTPASVVSPNVERELTVADEQVKPLLPVLAESTMIPPSLSFLLAGVQHVDLTTQRYPEAIAELHQALAAITARRASGAGAAGGPAAAGSGGTATA